MVTLEAVELPVSTYTAAAPEFPGTIFDIETGPLSWSKIEAFVGKFDPAGVDLSKIPGGEPFDPAAVKVGNLKPENRAAKIDEARERHQVESALYEKRCLEAIKNAKIAHKNKAIEKAALSATTGRVLLGGILDHGQYMLIEHERNEPALIRRTWEVIEAAKSVVGFNIYGFDLPFMFQRSKILNIAIPRDVIHRYGSRYYWNDKFIDLLEVWRAGGRDWIDLDSLARLLGLNGKSGDGADFANLYATDRPAALSYARNDLDVTAGIAGRLL